MRYGSLCSGIGGLDLAVESVFDATPAWFCEADPHAASVLERHWPGVPILPDLKTQDWTTVEPVELICAGYPCQPFSHAGARGGTDDPRHLWPFVADAVRVLRPRLVVLENVAGHLSLGFDRVLADLAALGFDAEWGVVRASDVGACHQRARLFVVATDADEGRRRRWGPSEPATEGRGHEGRQRRSTGAGALPTDPGGSGAWGNPGGLPRTTEAARRPGEHLHAPLDARTDVADTNGGGREGGCEPDGGQVEPELISPRRCDADRRGADAPDATHVGRPTGGHHGDGGPDLRTVVADTHGEGLEGRGAVPGGPGERAAGPAGVVAWGEFEPAVRRHEHVLGRAAPAPTDERGRLAVPFVEWMQMLPEGWVDGLGRGAALRALGNVVVPLQAIDALRRLT